MQAAIQAAVDKQAKKQQAIAAQVSAATDSRQRTELEGALKNEEHKQRQLQQVQQAFAALIAGAGLRQDLECGMSEGCRPLPEVVRDTVLLIDRCWCGVLWLPQQVLNNCAAKLLANEGDQQLPTPCLQAASHPMLITRICTAAPGVIAAGWPACRAWLRQAQSRTLQQLPL